MTAQHHGTHTVGDRRTVADILDAVAQTSARELPPYDPRNESRPVRPARAARGTYRSAAQVDETLKPFASDAHAGVSDRLIGSRTGLSPQQVKRWRSRGSIRGKRGRRPTELGTRFLIASLIGEPTTPVPHEVSPLHGEWRPPAYALRRPLRYDLFVRAVHALATDMTIEEIALAMGIDERDVAMAAIVHAERGAS